MNPLALLLGMFGSIIAFAGGSGSSGGDTPSGNTENDGPGMPDDGPGMPDDGPGMPDNGQDHGEDHGEDHGQDDGDDHGDDHGGHTPDPVSYTDITAFGVHPGVSMHIHVDSLLDGRTPITTEAHVIYNGLRAFLDLDPVNLDDIGRWAFANDLTNNDVPYGQDLMGVGLYYAMQGSKAGWIDDDAYDPQITADIQRAAREDRDEDVMQMVADHGHHGLADYLAAEGLDEAFINTLKMEPHYGGWMHGRAVGGLQFDNPAGYNAPANSAGAHDLNHLTVVNHAQTEPFYNDTFDWPQWSGRMVPDDDVINYFQSMLTLGNPKGEGIVAEDIPDHPHASAGDGDGMAMMAMLSNGRMLDETMPAHMHDEEDEEDLAPV